MGGWGVFLGIFFAAWPIDYFKKTLHINFPHLLFIILLLMVLNIVYILHLEFEDKQQLSDDYDELLSKNKSLKEANEKINVSIQSSPSKEEFNALKQKTSELDKKITSVVQTKNVSSIKISTTLPNNYSSSKTKNTNQIKETSGSITYYAIDSLGVVHKFKHQKEKNK